MTRSKTIQDTARHGPCSGPGPAIDPNLEPATARAMVATLTSALQDLIAQVIETGKTRKFCDGPLAFAVERARKALVEVRGA